jgi:hypothetical protein
LSAIFRAFVSSTFEDLKNQRSLVVGALRNARFFVDPMEDWTATTDAPKTLSVSRVKGCDLCVLLVGFRRGHVPSGGTLSVTQLEYDAAVEEGIDVLVFMLDEQAAWPRKFDELDKDPGIRQWRSQLMEIATVGLFNHDPSSIKIDPAISRWVMERLNRYRNAMALEHLDELLRKAAVKNSATYRTLERARSMIESVQALAAESGPRVT